MRLALYSDLHLEFAHWEPPSLDVDVVILAGDISVDTHGIQWAAKAFPGVPEVLYVAGNHEYYDDDLGLLDEMQKPLWEQLGVHFLEQRCIEIAGVHFLGCTLWSDFNLYGEDAAETHMGAAKGSINDYWMIRAHGRTRLEPRDTQTMHQASVEWLDAELSKPFDGKAVVITHFAPHPRCVAPEHQGKDVSPYFVSDLAWLMEKHRVDLWCYGHTHTNISFVAENGCRVVSNQRGYPREQSPGFLPDLVIEV